MNILDEKPILSVVCNEPEGAITRFVRPMSLHPDNLQKFWEHSKQFKTLFSSDVKSFNDFMNLIVDGGPDGYTPIPKGLFWVIDDFVGVFYMTRIEVGKDALVHYSFFDRRHKGRHRLVYEMLKYVFKRYEFNRLSVEIPMYVTEHTFKFVERIGFRVEGRKRKAALFDNALFDVKLFGLLRSDISLGE